jgi:hypothetical protein
MWSFFKNCLNPNPSSKVYPVVPPLTPLTPHVPYRNIPESSYYDNSYQEDTREDYNQVDTSNIEKHYKNLTKLIATPAQKWKTSSLEAYNMDNAP